MQVKCPRPSSRLSRRSFLVSAAAAGLANYGRDGANAKMVRVCTEDTKLVRARKKAAHRPRRLVYNDDADVTAQWKPDSGLNGFFGHHLDKLVGTPVDNYQWCMMWGIGTQTPDKARYWETQKMGKPFHPSMADPTPLVIQRCREHGIEVFGSIRMNDTHDAHGIPYPVLKYPLKVEHPELLLGNETQRNEGKDGTQATCGRDKTLAAWIWSGLNYAHPQVREDRFCWIDHTASRYDFDGVDLNFFRMPWFFKIGEESRHMHLMTDLIRRARRRFDQISRRRGQPILLGVRPPATVEACLRIGIDIETWLKEGLIDRILSGGGYVAFSTPYEEMIDLGHRYDVPVYPCINVPMGVLNDKDEALRGAAANMWQAGADGIYLWNYNYRQHGKRGEDFGCPPSEEFRHLCDIGNRQRLTRLDKIFAVDYIRDIFYYTRMSAPAPLPLELGERADGKLQSVPVRVGDDIRGAARSHDLRDVRLQLQLDGNAQGDEIHARFNGNKLSGGKPRENHWIDFDLEPKSVKQRMNNLQVGIARRGLSANDGLTLKQAWVWVRYLS